MAHDLETHDGTTFYADSRDDAWHRLGQKVGHNMTVAEAMDNAHLGGWNVRKTPLTIPAEVTDDGVFPQIDVAEKFGIVRTNPVTGSRDYLGVVGKDYNPIQNEENAAFLQTLVDEFGANLETAGSLGGGTDVFLTMKLPHTMQIMGSNGFIDKTEYYLAALNNHNGQQAFRTILTPIRVVCRNTQQMAIRAAKMSWSVRHTENATGRVQEARAALGLVWKSIDTIDDEFKRMSEVGVSVDEANAFAEKLFDLGTADPDGSAATQRRNKASAVVKLFVESPTIQPIAGTRYALYNAVTEYVDWYAGVRGAGDDATEAQKQELRAIRTIRQLDSSASLKSAAFNLLRV